jgi:hypothetical protein
MIPDCPIGVRDIRPYRVGQVFVGEGNHVPYLTVIGLSSELPDPESLS